MCVTTVKSRHPHFQTNSKRPDCEPRRSSMFKKTLLTAAAALAIITGGSAIGASDAEAGVKFNVTFGHGYYGGYGGYGGYYGGYNGGYSGPSCYWKKHQVKKYFWHNGHKHTKWVWHSHKHCY